MQEVAAQMTVCLAVADDRFDGGSSPQFAFDLSVDAAFLPRAKDPARIWCLVADISLVHVSPLDLGTPVKGSVSSMTSFKVWPS